VLVALARRSWRGRLAVGALAGLGQFSIGLAWALQFSAAGYVAIVIVESAILAVGAALVPPAGVLRLGAAAGAVTLSEWARDSWPFGGVPLGSGALGQVDGPFAFASRLGGPLLVIFCAALAGGGLLDFGRLIFARQSRWQASAARDGLALLAAAALAGGGYVVAPTPASAGRGSHSLRVAIVQGGGQRGLTALQVPAARVYRAALSETARITGHLQLILWPEDVISMGSTPFVGSSVERTIASLARRHRATFVVGYTEDVGRAGFLNEIAAFSPAGRLEATFLKVHRVPFGEYVPDRGFFSHLANLSAVPRDAVPGTGSGLMRTTAGPLAVLVSYEVFFAGRARSGVQAGGQLILVPTNTSSYSSGQAPAQEIAASRLQAIDENRWLLQAAPTGYSAVIAPSGSVLRRSSLSVPAVIEATVPLIGQTTPYSDTGDAPVLIGSVLLLGLGWAIRSRPTQVPDPREEEETPLPPPAPEPTPAAPRSTRRLRRRAGSPSR
jgi:apolipoprotein N-acyltransferase